MTQNYFLFFYFRVAQPMSPLNLCIWKLEHLMKNAFNLGKILTFLKRRQQFFTLIPTSLRAGAAVKINLNWNTGAKATPKNGCVFFQGVQVLLCVGTVYWWNSSLMVRALSKSVGKMAQTTEILLYRNSEKRSSFATYRKDSNNERIGKEIATILSYFFISSTGTCIGFHLELKIRKGKYIEVLMMWEKKIE